MKTKYCSPQLEIFNIKITNSLLAGSNEIHVDKAGSGVDAGYSLGREFDFDDEEEDYQSSRSKGWGACPSPWNK